MGNFGEVIVGRIGCFKSDTIFLPSISDIASQAGNRCGEGGGWVMGGHKTSTRPHSGASYTHALISRELIAFPYMNTCYMTTKCLFIRDCTYS